MWKRRKRGQQKRNCERLASGKSYAPLESVHYLLRDRTGNPNIEQNSGVYDGVNLSRTESLKTLNQLLPILEQR